MKKPSPGKALAALMILAVLFGCVTGKWWIFVLSALAFAVVLRVAYPPAKK